MTLDSLLFLAFIALCLVSGAMFGARWARTEQLLANGVRAELINHEAEADHDDEPARLTEQ